MTLIKKNTVNYVFFLKKIKGVYMFVNDSSQSINHLPTSKTVSTSASQGNLQVRKVEHLRKDNIKSGSDGDIKGFAALFFIPFAIVTGGVLKFPNSHNETLLQKVAIIFFQIVALIAVVIKALEGLRDYELNKK